MFLNPFFFCHLLLKELMKSKIPRCARRKAEGRKKRRQKGKWAPLFTELRRSVICVQWYNNAELWERMT